MSARVERKKMQDANNNALRHKMSMNARVEQPGRRNVKRQRASMSCACRECTLTTMWTRCVVDKNLSPFTCVLEMSDLLQRFYDWREIAFTSMHAQISHAMSQAMAETCALLKFYFLFVLYCMQGYRCPTCNDDIVARYHAAQRDDEDWVVNTMWSNRSLWYLPSDFIPCTCVNLHSTLFHLWSWSKE